MKKILIHTIAIIFVLTVMTECFADEAKPLFEFDYNGVHIETFGAYSVVDGKRCETHRYFVKDGNLVLIDQNLQPKARDVFIHFADGKSYIAVINTDGKMLSLGTEDLCTKLVDFTNKNIVSLSDNINSGSTKMLFRYEDGSTVAYDCITGKIIERTAATEKRDPVGFVSDYISDLISRSTSGLIDASGLKAQSLVVTLNNSGATLEQLIDAGIVNGIEEDYDSADIDNGYIGEVIDYTSEMKFDTGVVENEHVSDIVNTTYDYSQNEAYRNLMESRANELSTDQLTALRGVFARIAAGESVSDINNTDLAFITEPDESDMSDSTDDSENTDPSDNNISSVTHDSENNGNKKPENDKSKEKEKILNDVKDALKSVESERKEKKFIVPKEKEKYLAVYNADEKHYDIYSQKTLLTSPDKLESENKRIEASVDVSELNKMLSGTKLNDSQDGLIVFSVLIGMILCVVAAVLLIAKKSIFSKRAN